MTLELFFNSPTSGAFSGSFITDITGSPGFIGTASEALTASFAQTAATASFISGFSPDSASFATSASHAVQADSASLAATASFVETASFAQTAATASLATTASYAQKAAVAPLNINLNNFFGAEARLRVPTVVTEHDDGQRVFASLQGYTQARIIVRQTRTPNTTPGGWLAPQFSADEVSWLFFDGITGPSASLDVEGTIVTPWANITGSGQDDVFIRWVTFSGSDAGAQNRPAVASINLQVK